MVKEISADEVREARRASGLSARAAAALVYRKQRWFQACESGERTMDPAIWELWLLKVKLKNSL
jgi:ribosome-binding protein aMBF1 (putative translation factor)